jgi:hypothetical protein
MAPHVVGDPGHVAGHNALDATLALAVLRWQPDTDYLDGQQVVTPTNEVVSAIGDFTSGSSFDPTSWVRNTTSPAAIDGGTP